MSGRCRSCDSKMTESDMKRKHAITGEYLDLCSHCLSEVNKIVPLPIDGDSIDTEQGENYVDEAE